MAARDVLGANEAVVVFHNDRQVFGRVLQAVRLHLPAQVHVERSAKETLESHLWLHILVSEKG